jgi:DNA-binding NtrC family response regulator
MIHVVCIDLPKENSTPVVKLLKSTDFAPEALMNTNLVPQSQSPEPNRQSPGVRPVQDDGHQRPSMSLRSVRAGAEVAAIHCALQETGWNRKRAAKLLSISYRGLLYKIRRHNITAEGRGPLVPLERKD